MKKFKKISKQKWSIFFGLLIVLIVLIIFETFKANAYENDCGKWCDPTPIIKPTSTPTPTIGCGVKPTGIIFTAFINNCISPSVTPTPTASVSGTPVPTSTPVPQNGSTGGDSTPPTFAGSSTNAPSAPTCNIPFSAPVLTSITAGGSGELTLNWLESDQNIDKFSIIYGKVGQPLNMGVPSLPGNSRSYTIQGLQTGEFINAQIWGFKGGCAEKSNIVDPIVR